MPAVKFESICLCTLNIRSGLFTCIDTNYDLSFTLKAKSFSVHKKYIQYVVNSK